MGDASRAGHWILLGAIIALATLVRVVAIDSQGLWSEEAYAIVLSDWSVADMMLKPTDPTPVLYFALHKLFLSPDASLAALRSISVVFGVLSVGLIYILGRLAYGAWGGLLAAALLAVWSGPVDYSQEARAYALMFFLTLLTSVGFLLYARAINPPPGERRGIGAGWAKIALVIFGIGNVLSFYAHLVSIIWIALTSLMLIALVVRRRDRVTEVAVLFAAMALCAVPGVYRLLQHSMSGGFAWLQQRGLAGFARLCAEIFLPLGSWGAASTKDISAAAPIKAVVMGVFVIGLGAAAFLGRRRVRSQLRERPGVFWLIVAYLLVPVLIWLYGFAVNPILMGKNILFAVPGFILLITGLCLALDKRAAAWAGCAAVLLYGLSLLATGTIRERENWRAAYDYLAGAVAAGDVVTICPFEDFSALRYHAAKPVDVPMVTRVDGSTVRIETALGTDPHWDQTLFRSTAYPHVTAWLAGKRAAMNELGVASTLELKPGQSVWRVDGHCTDKAVDMDRWMSAAGYDPGIVRYQDNATRATTILIRQYRVNAPISLEIWDIPPKP